MAHKPSLRLALTLLLLGGSLGPSLGGCALLGQGLRPESELRVAKAQFPTAPQVVRMPGMWQERQVLEPRLVGEDWVYALNRSLSYEMRLPGGSLRPLDRRLRPEFVAEVAGVGLGLSPFFVPGMTMSNPVWFFGLLMAGGCAVGTGLSLVTGLAWETPDQARP